MNFTVHAASSFPRLVSSDSLGRPAGFFRALASALACCLAIAGCGESETPADSSATRPADAAAQTLVVYCAHDRAYSESILNAFTARTGIAVRAKYDSELTKSLALVELIRQEKDAPQCDVFWNNELLGTMDLADDDLLEEDHREGKQGDALWRDHRGRWVGFAGRLRVWIVNADRMRPDGEAVDAAFIGKDLSRFTVANPIFGTTRTHYTVLWSVLGGDAVKKWDAAAKERGLVPARSNGQTKSLVAEGRCDFGWTDTDDYFEAKDAGKPVTMMPVRLRDPRSMIDTPAGVENVLSATKGKVICIPNTAAVIRGSKNRDAARRLVDYLASPETQITLANGPARQIPLCPLTEEQEAKLSKDVRAMRPWLKDVMDPAIDDQARRDCLAWLKSEAAK